MIPSYELTRIDPNAFEHLVNHLALRVLGSGHTGFGPGSDGGRDGYFEGEAAYPSLVERWSGVWYIQSKFHAPHLSKNPQTWLLDQIEAELKEFSKSDTKRKWPDIWIVATNIDPSGVPQTGAFDAARAKVAEHHPELADRFHIWGGAKIIQLLSLHGEIASHYGHFLTPGHVLSELFQQLSDVNAGLTDIASHLILREFTNQQYTRLEQAGSREDARPGIHRLFVDLPFDSEKHGAHGMVMEYLSRTVARNHRPAINERQGSGWRKWNRHPARARIWFVRGGPGQGKSTIGQYLSQIHRAALVLQQGDLKALPRDVELAEDIRAQASQKSHWPAVPRIPITVELKDYAHWYGNQNSERPRGILTYLAARISIGVEQEVLVGTLKRAIRHRSWLVIFDGLDEVSNDVKDDVAAEIIHFVERVAGDANSDLFTLCTSRRQGYSGQLDQLDAPTVDLAKLPPPLALECARPLLELDRGTDEAATALQVLTEAIQSKAIQELMTTPLQAHIMAVVVRGGGRPPERRWQLFSNFYQVILSREANRNLNDPALAKVLREEEALLKSIHNRLGFVLHARAERSSGTQTRLHRSEFQELVEYAVHELSEGDSSTTVGTLMRATEQRLVLVSTPDDGDHLRFDVRQLQEFFAAEFLYESVTAEDLSRRIEVIAGDSHWREVVHFLLSGLVENGRLTDLALAINVLEAMDEGEGDPVYRILNRRLARGMAIAARLLEEGVLEQDRRIRQQFRKSLAPLGGATSLSSLDSLINVKQRQSATWLQSLLASLLKEASLSENIGAAIVLAHILDDNDVFVEEFTKFLRATPTEYVKTVLASRFEFRHYSHRHFEAKRRYLQTWILTFVLGELTSQEWHKVDPGVTSRSLRALAGNQHQSEQVIANLGLSQSEQLLLAELLRLETDDLPDVSIGSRFAMYSEDWTTGLDLTKQPLLAQVLSEPISARGMFRIVHAILRFAATRTYSDWTGMLEILSAERESVDSIPFALRHFIPLDGYNSSDHWDAMCSLDETRYHDLIATGRLAGIQIPRPVRSFHIAEDEQGWKELCDTNPALAWHLWNEPPLFYDHEGERQSHSRAIVKALVDQLEDQPQLAIIAPGRWGQLLREFPERASELRDLFRRNATEPVGMRSWTIGFDPFTLEFPDDIPLLPHLVTSLPWMRGLGPANEASDSAQREIARLVARLCPNPDDLDAIVADGAHAIEYRAAALVLELLHPAGHRKVEESVDELVEFTSEIGGWMVDLVVSYLRLSTRPYTSVSRQILGRILDQNRDNLAVRKAIDPILYHWRETSLAPVHEAGAFEHWLHRL